MDPTYPVRSVDIATSEIKDSDGAHKCMRTIVVQAMYLER